MLVLEKEPKTSIDYENDYALEHDGKTMNNLFGKGLSTAHPVYYWLQRAIIDCEKGDTGMRKSIVCLLGVTIFLAAEWSLVYASETGQIMGTIRTSENKALADVTITVTSTNLMGERTAVTNKRGRFTIPALPIGMYLLQFEHEKMKTIKRPDVKVLPYATVKIKLTMMAGSPEDIEILSGPSDLIDVQSSGPRKTMESDFTRRLPGSDI